MVTMGFPKDEITESLVGQKYDEVMATYLLLGRKPPEASLRHLFLELSQLSAKGKGHSSEVVCCSRYTTLLSVSIVDLTLFGAPLPPRWWERSNKGELLHKRRYS